MIKITKKQAEEIEFIEKKAMTLMNDGKFPKVEITDETREDYIEKTVKGKKSPSGKSDPNPLFQAKRMLDLNVKMWREDLRDGLITIDELKEYDDSNYFHSLIDGIVNGLPNSKIMREDPEKYVVLSIMTPLDATKTMSMQKIIKLEDHIYGGFTTVVIGSWQDYVKLASGKYGPDYTPPYPAEGCPETEYMGGYHDSMFVFKPGYDPASFNIIWVNGNLSNVEIVSCLSHELLHAGIMLMELIGVKISGNDEVLTYWHTWAMRKCLNDMALFQPEKVCQPRE
ncbi:MAG: hypothetical protein M0R06_02070 [Sphaerochaeta sp.]|jgi:hypothetical protein|nr:hypothetical protein [Sphaerochaeta sp.]